MLKFFFIIFFSLGLTSAAIGAPIGHTFVEQNSAQTATSATLADVTGAAIASGNFTADKKYLLLISFTICSDSNGALSQVDILHGSTSFLDATITTVHLAAGCSAYNWLDVWTAVTGEGIKLQFASNGTAIATIDNIAMFSMNLSDDVIENTDWFYAERGNDDALSTTPTDGASITFTPGTASHDWLVIAHALIFTTDTTTRIISRLVRSGEAGSTDPEWRIISGNVADVRWAYNISRVFTLGAASNTFKEQSEASATAGTRLESKIFAINLNKFREHVSAYTADDLAINNTDFATQVQTISITPTVQSDVLIGAFFGNDHANSAARSEFRVQLDNTDQPAGQTAAAYQYEAMSNDNADEPPLALITMASSLSAAAHTIDVDASQSTGGSGTAQYRSLWAFTMELAASVRQGSMSMMGVGK